MNTFFNNCQMPNMPFPFPFPNPFNMPGMNRQDDGGARDEEPRNCSPFDFFGMGGNPQMEQFLQAFGNFFRNPGMNGQAFNPFSFFQAWQNPQAARQPEAPQEEAPEGGEEEEGGEKTGGNGAPFDFFSLFRNPQMEQFLQAFGSFFQNPGANAQAFNPFSFFQGWQAPQAEGQQAFNPFAFFQPWQNPQMEQFLQAFGGFFRNPGMNGQAFNPFAFFQGWQAPQTEGQQAFNPFAFFQPWQNPQAGRQPNCPFGFTGAGQNPQMEQFLQAFGSFFRNPGANSQAFNPFAFFQGWQAPHAEGQQTFNPFAFFQPWQNPQADGQRSCPFGFTGVGQNPQMEQFMEQFREQLKKLIPTPGAADGKDGGLPFGMPAKLLQFLLNLESSPDGLSRFQRFLDFLFNSYNKPAAEPEAAGEEKTEEPGETEKE